MGKFKEFIFTEQIGLGQLGLQMNNLANSQWLGNTIAGALITSDVSGSDQFPPFGQTGAYPKPDVDLTIPSVEKTGRITALMTKRNPIYVRLSDGTEANFTYDQFNRIQGQPAIGKTMTISFQRRPDDTSSGYSRINHIIVHD